MGIGLDGCCKWGWGINGKDCVVGKGGLGRLGGICGRVRDGYVRGIGFWI